MSVAIAEPSAEPAAAFDLTGRAELPPSMVERMTLILDAFDGSGSARLTLEDVAQKTHLPRSTAHRILDQLVRLSWLEHTSSGYALGRRAFALVGGDHGHGELRAAAAPLLHALALRTGMVVHLAVLEGADISYLDKVGGRFATAVPSRVGGRAPAHSTALGKAILAWLEAEQVDRLLEAGITRLTHRTITDLGTFHSELHRVRQRHGLAFERGECFPDIACAAVAVRGPQGPIGAISAVGEVDAPLEKAAPLVVEAARRTSAALFGESDLRQRRRRSRGQVPEGTWSTDVLNRLAAVEAHVGWL
jgi:DNA-binding IclR family transcriptional regulator